MFVSSERDPIRTTPPHLPQRQGGSHRRFAQKKNDLPQCTVHPKVWVKIRGNLNTGFQMNFLGKITRAAPLQSMPGGSYYDTHKATGVVTWFGAMPAAMDIFNSLSDSFSVWGQAVTRPQAITSKLQSLQEIAWASVAFNLCRWCCWWIFNHVIRQVSRRAGHPRPTRGAPTPLGPW